MPSRSMRMPPGVTSACALLGISDVGYVTAGSTWQPSEQVGMLSGALPLLTTSVQFRFTSVDTGGAFKIDDVYLDPLAHR